jgi:hypothetical protein
MQELVQVLGALVTIAGLVIVAPFEAGRALPAVWRSTAPARSRARNWLSRWLPFLRRDIRVNIADMAGGLSVITGSATGRMGLTDQGTTEEQLTAIRAAVASIHTELDGLRAEDRALRAELTVKLDQLAEDHAALRRDLEEQWQEQGQLNARGFPLAAVGALLAGVPGSWLAAAGWWLAGPLVAVWAVAAAIAGRWLWDARDKLAAGWHAFRPPAQQAKA